METEIIALGLLLVVSLFVSVSNWLPVPVGLVVAATAALTDVDPWHGSAAAAAGIVAGRWLGSLEARAKARAVSPPGTAQATAQLRAFLGSHPAYGQVTFMLGLVGLLPHRLLWRAVGAMRAPVTYLALGTFVGQLVIVRLTTWLWTVAGGLAADTDEEIAGLLATVGIVLTVLALLNRIDWQHRREHGRWRLRRERDIDTRVGFVTNRLGPDRPPGTPGDADDHDVLDLPPDSASGETDVPQDEPDGDLPDDSSES